MSPLLFLFMIIALFVGSIIGISSLLKRIFSLQANIMKLSLIITASIIVFIAIILTYRHIKWKYIIYPRLEKTLEQKYNTSFRCINEGLSYAETHNRSPILDFKINHYIVHVENRDNPHINFDCWIDTDYKPYEDDYISIKEGYEAYLKIKPLANEYLDNYLMSCIMEETKTEDNDSDYTPNLNIYVALHYSSHPDVENIITFADRIVTLDNELAHGIRLHIVISYHPSFASINEKEIKRIASMADFPYSHEFGLFLTTEMHNEQMANPSYRSEYLNHTKMKYQEKMESVSKMDR